MKVCHNCRGKGLVDGGFTKRIDKEIIVLKRTFDQDVVQIRTSKIDNAAKDEKVTDLEKTLNKNIEALNADHRIANCLYCEGSGARK